MPQKNTKRIGVYLSPETYQRVKTEAAKERVGLARYIRYALWMRFQEIDRAQSQAN